MRELHLDPSAVGEISEAKVLAALLAHGETVLMPWGNSKRYDFVIDRGSDAGFLRIQVKTGRLVDGAGAIFFPTCSSYAHRGRPTRTYAGDVDYFGVYCPDTGDVYLVPVLGLGSRGAHLRLTPPRNKQNKGVRDAGQYKIS